MGHSAAKPAKNLRAVNKAHPRKKERQILKLNILSILNYILLVCVCVFSFSVWKTKFVIEKYDHCLIYLAWITLEVGPL